jgi:trehalose synthase
MSANVREVTARPAASLELYRTLDHLGPLCEEVQRLGERVSDLLGTRRVWMLNSTASGGGVAEMLPPVCSLLDEVGVDARWLVLEPHEPRFFEATKALHHRIHGRPGAIDPASALDVYDRVSAAAAHDLRHLDPGDLLVVHDPQPVGVGVHLRAETRPHLLWRCHIGVPFENENTASAWAFLRPYLVPYARLLFSAATYVPDEYTARAGVVTPGIDPLSHKNRELRPYKLAGILRSAGLVDGPEQPPWARFARPVLRFVDGRWEASPIPDLLFRPVILQVSRFDPLKGFDLVIPAFCRLLVRYPERVPHLRAPSERVLAELAAVQLVLAGPDPAGVSDDPEGARVLADLCDRVRRLPEEVARRVHLLRLPMESAKENALVVNALQRLAVVVVQASREEGFGLTATEALWKATPVVASNVGGLEVQIRDRIDGRLVDDVRDPDAWAEILLEALAFPKAAEAMARSGRNRVREHFHVLAQVRSWLLEFQRILEAPAEGLPAIGVR